MMEEPKSELYFSWWIDELKEAGLIESHINQPDPIQLSEPVLCQWETLKNGKIKPVVKRLIAEHIYTADFQIKFTYEALNVIVSNVEYIDADENILLSCDPKNKLITFGMEAMVECKPIFDQNNMTREFKLNQKWLYFNRVFVNLVKIPDFFEKTFTPLKYVEDQVYKKRTQDKKTNVWHEVGESRIRYKVRLLNELLINSTKFQEVGDKIKNNQLKLEI
jgi:hypothetical protein